MCFEVLHLILFICTRFPGGKQFLQTGREAQHLKRDEVIKTVVLQAACSSEDGNFPGCQKKRGRKGNPEESEGMPAAPGDPTYVKRNVQLQVHLPRAPSQPHGCGQDRTVLAVKLAIKQVRCCFVVWFSFFKSVTI